MERAICNLCNNVLEIEDAKENFCGKCGGPLSHNKLRRVSIVDSWYEIQKKEDYWCAVTQSLIDLESKRCTGGNILDFLQENEQAWNLVMAQNKSLIDGLEKENEEFSSRIVWLKERYQILADALLTANRILKKDWIGSEEDEKKISYAISILNPKD